ncbi:MAG: ATP-dependent DNA helicase [Cytophagales bacterium]|nr:MAG: ATP-dependent DNA helicase [Cytophagales bacterium]
MYYLKGLNEPQSEAVLHTDGPLMIIAGAGSGKTRVLTYRIAHLIYNKVEPFNIMALTFTNKAAGEMRQRIEKLVGTEARNLWMGTFHSVFAKILRIEAEKIGFDHNFTIYDTDDSKSLLKAIIKEMNLDDKVYKPSTVLNRISGAKNRMVSWQEYNQNPIFLADDIAYQRPEIGKIFKNYQLRLFKANAMDFDDILFFTNILFKEHLDILYKYQHKFKYLLIDEFQDTNFAQYEIVRKLASVHQNICVVGDDAQSIYAFRGADIQNILNFEKDYPDLKVIRLEQNYRSTKTIVQVANSLIAHNQKQLKKNVWTDNEQGTPIKIVKAHSDSEEGRLVAQSIFEEKNNAGLTNSHFAVLYRTNAQSRSLEEALRRMNIKYKIVGGLSFYQRREIKDLLAYFRMAVNPNDEEALKRIINLPKRGIGDTTVAKMIVFAYENDLPIWQVVSNIQKYLTGKNVTTIDTFAQLIKSFQIVANQKDAYKAATEIAKNSGLIKELYEDKTVDGLARYENVQELLNAVKEFTDNIENEDKSLSAFLQQIALLTSVDESKDDGEERITLMTIHASKGLEFSHVYIVGMEEDLFPSQMMLSSRADLEEERRLFYVAITRAENKLTLSYALSRYQHGRLKECEPSRFLEEIDKDHIQHEKTRNQNIEVNTSFVKNLMHQRQGYTKVSTPKPKATPPPADFKPSNPNDLKVGIRVEHIKFGIGTVKELELQGNDRKAIVDFDDAGEKTLLLSFAKLRIL